MAEVARVLVTEEIAEPAGEMQPGFLRRAVGARQAGVAPPADFDAAKEIGFRARHAVERRRAEADLGAENLRVGMEADRRAVGARRVYRQILAWLQTLNAINCDRLGAGHAG